MKAVKRLGSQLLVVMLTLSMLFTSVAIPTDSYAAVIYPKMTVKVVGDDGKSVDKPKIEVSYLNEYWSDIDEDTISEKETISAEADGSYKVHPNTQTTIKVSKEGYESKTETFRPKAEPTEFERLITLKKIAGNEQPVSTDKLTAVVDRFKAEQSDLKAKYGKDKNVVTLVNDYIKAYKDLDTDGVSVKLKMASMPAVISADGNITYAKPSKPYISSEKFHAVTCDFIFHQDGQAEQVVRRKVDVGWDIDYLNSKVDREAPSVSFTRIKNANTAENNIKTDLNLYQIRGNNYDASWTVTKWESSNPDVISIEKQSGSDDLSKPLIGKVNRQKEDTQVTLKATITINNNIISELDDSKAIKTKVKEFKLTVKAASDKPEISNLPPIVEKLKKDGEIIRVKYSKDKNVNDILLNKIKELSGVDTKGVTVSLLSTSKKEVIAEDGVIKFVSLAKPNSWGNSSSQVICRFTLHHEGEPDQTVNKTFIVGWNQEYLNKKIDSEAEKLNFDKIKDKNKSEKEISSGLILPQMDGSDNKVAWTNIAWESSKPDVISVENDAAGSKFMTPKIGKIKQPKNDTEVVLTAKIGVNDKILLDSIENKEELKTVTKEFKLTVKGNESGSEPGVSPGTEPSENKLAPIVDKFKKEFGALVAKYGENVNAAEMVVNKIKGYKGIDTEGVSVKVINSDKEGVITNDGKINYLTKESLSHTGINHENVNCTFEFSYKNEKQSASRVVMVGWNVPHVNKKIKAVSDGISFDTIKKDNKSEQEILSNLTLPQIDGTSVFKAWSLTKWESSHPNIIEVKNSSAYAGNNIPQIGLVKKPKQDTVVTLTAKTGVNKGILNENIQKDTDFETVTKSFKLTVKGSGEVGYTAEQLQAILDKYITVDSLAYFSSEDGKLDPNNVIADIQLPRYTKIKDENQKLVFKNKEIKYSTDDDAISITGYRGAVDRFKDGPKTVNLIVTFTRDEITVTKKIPLTISVISDAELDAEIKAMEYAKAHYFDGINNGKNENKDSIKENLHSFYEFHFDGENKPVWVYAQNEGTGKGIVPISYFNSSVEAETNGYTTFKSSNTNVIRHQNLIVTRQASDTKVTVTSWLSSARFGALANKYKTNAKLQKLYKQEVSVELTVLGKASEKEILKAKIAEAKNLASAISEGDKAGQFAKGTKTKLEQAISAAEVVSGSGTSEAKVLKDAIEALEKAMKAANDAQNPGATILIVIQNEKNSVTNVYKEIQISPDEAGKYGYFKDDAFADKVTVLDAMAAVHRDMFGEEFVAHPSEYLDVPKNGWINAIFGTKTSDLGYYVNDKYPMGADGNGTVANDTVLKYGDKLTIFRYFDKDYKAIYMNFDKNKVEADVSEEFTLTLNGQKTNDDWSKVTAPYAKAKVVLKDPSKESDNIIAEAMTDEKGIARFAVDKPGEYVATVTELVEGETASKLFIAPYAEVKINAKETPEVKPEDERIEGTDRYQTAYANADALKKQLGIKEFNSAVIACGNDYPDALSAGYLAKIKNAPLLLSNETESKFTADYIRKNVKKGSVIYLIGGEAVLPESLKAELTANYNIKRLSGEDRYMTNLAVLKEAGVKNEELMVCSGENYADAISASATGRPVLIVGAKLLDVQREFLKNIDSAKFYIIGGNAVISRNLEKELGEFKQVERIFGSDRYTTSIEIAKKFFDMKSGTVIFAYGEGFADGLVSSVTAMANNAPIILTNEHSLTETAKFIKETGAVRSITMGGTKLISEVAIKVLMNRK